MLRARLGSGRAAGAAHRRQALPLAPSAPRCSCRHVVSASSGDTPPGAGTAVTMPTDASSAAGSDKAAALAARVAAAKAYKQQQQQAVGTAASISSQEALSEAQQAELQQQYAAQLRQQQQELAAQSSEYTQYLQQQQQQQQQDEGRVSTLDRLAAADPGLQQPSERGSPARPDFYTSRDAPGVDQLLGSTPRRRGAGSADEAADWLRGVLAPPAADAAAAIDPNLRAEEFTAAKEQQMKQRGAEIITAFPEDWGQQQPEQQQQQQQDAAGGSGEADEGGGGEAAASSSSGAGSETGEGYKPKVTTWGVFPRPANISATFGGGRNIRPGQALETAEQRAKREADFAAALAAYKKSVNLDTISPADLAAAQATFNDATRLFNAGKIAEALPLFDEVRAAVPFKSKLGGLSTLQAAVCYDTLGNSRQAEALYKRLKGHPTSDVGRKARQLVFGFQAMAFLKTENLSYAVKKEDYLDYFRRSADRTRVYVASPEEAAADRAEAAKAAAVAAGVVLGPVVVLGALLLTK